MKTQQPRFLNFLYKIFRLFIDEEILLSIIEDIEDRYTHLSRTKGILIAGSICSLKLLIAFFSFIIDSIKWGLIMFNNYLKIALMNLKKHKGFSFINITGLAVG